MTGQANLPARRTPLWHGLVWVLTAVVAALWSLLCWALLQLLTGPDWRTLTDSAWLDWLAQWRLPAWLAAWLPMADIGTLQAWLVELGAWLQSALVQAPGVLGWLTPLVWAGWAIGMLVLLLLGVVGSVLVVALQRQPTPAAAIPSA